MVFHPCPIRPCNSVYDRSSFLKKHLLRVHGIELNRPLHMMLTRPPRPPKTSRRDRRTDPFRDRRRPPAQRRLFTNTVEDAIDLRTPSPTPLAPSPPRYIIDLSPESSPESTPIAPQRAQTPEQATRSLPVTPSTPRRPIWVTAPPNSQTSAKLNADVQVGSSQPVEDDADDETSQREDEVYAISENEATWGYRKPGRDVNDSSSFARPGYPASEATEVDTAEERADVNEISKEEGRDRWIEIGKPNSDYDELFFDFGAMIPDNEKSSSEHLHTRRAISTEHVSNISNTSNSCSTEAIDAIDDSLSKRSTNAFEPFLQQAEVLLEVFGAPSYDRSPSSLSAASPNSPLCGQSQSSHKERRLSRCNTMEGTNGMKHSEFATRSFYPSVHSPDIPSYTNPVLCFPSNHVRSEDRAEKPLHGSRRERLQAIALELLDIAMEE